MITTVTLNPCNDKTVYISHFTYGGMNRVESQRFDIAGKGFNVARCVSRLGGQAVATGFLFKENGMMTQNVLEGEGVECDCLYCEGSVRCNTKIFDRSAKTITEINEPGERVDETAQAALIERIKAWATRSSMVVLSGSLPPNIGTDYYATIIEQCQSLCPVVLDTEGEALRRGIGKKPWMIKPNRYELELLVDSPLPTLEFVKAAAQSIVREGVEIVAVSLGGEGALIASAEGVYFSGPMDGVAVRGTVGAGDSMVAGICLAKEQGLPVDQMLRWGVASASSCVAQEGSGLAVKEQVDLLLPAVAVRKLN